METQHEIRRHVDGTVDFDFYRREAAMLRREAKTRFVKGLGFQSWRGLVRPLIALAAIVIALALMPRGSAAPPDNAHRGSATRP